MVLAGNKTYATLDDLPSRIPVFPLTGALLLPRAHLPLNIFEPRYVAMTDHALAHDRVIGIVQPRFEDPSNQQASVPAICAVGGLGRLVSFQETGDGRYLISLEGIARFRIREEIDTPTPFRMADVAYDDFLVDVAEERGEADVDRAAVIRVFKDFLEANDLEADWKSVNGASNEALVNTLAMMSPYGPAEKQALLEAPDLKARAATLVAITEMALARQGDEKPVLN